MMASFPIIRCQAVDCNGWAEYWVDIPGDDYKVRIYVCEEHFRRTFKWLYKVLDEHDLKEHKIPVFIRGS